MNTSEVLAAANWSSSASSLRVAKFASGASGLIKNPRETEALVDWDQNPSTPRNRALQIARGSSKTLLLDSAPDHRSQRLLSLSDPKRNFTPRRIGEAFKSRRSDEAFATSLARIASSLASSTRRV